MSETLDRLTEKMRSERLSARAVSSMAGVSHSTLSRAIRGDGKLTEASERLLKFFLGDDVGPIRQDAMRDRAQEIGRLAARAFEGEIVAMVMAALKEEGNG